MATGEQVIEAYICNNENESVSLADFVKDNKELIASTITSERDFRDYWSLLFNKVVRRRGARVISATPDWGSVCLLYVTNRDFTSDCEQAITPISPEPSSKSSSADTSANTSSYSLKPNDKKNIEAMFDSIMKDKNKLWHLKTGTIVEEKMKQHGLKCNFEHPCHSLILDPWDKTWSQYFTEDELNEIMSYNVPDILPLPPPLQEYINKFKHALHWMESSILKVLDLLYYDIIHKYTSEADLLKRIWCFIDCAFDVSTVNVISGEHVSKSSSLRVNNNRVLPGIDKMERKKTGSKVDLLFTTEIDELGTAEAGKHTDTNTTKAVVEYGIKTPKILKDMIYNIVDKNTSTLREIQTFGFIIAGLEILPMVMDCPNGVVCRINRASQWLCFPTTARNFKNRIEALFQMVHSAKTNMENVLDKLDDAPINFSYAKPSSPIPPSFMPIVEVSKKRKLLKENTSASLSPSS